MSIDARAKGKSYVSPEYEVGKEKIREYAQAVGEEHPVYFDRGAARTAGFRDIPAPPMFAVVYSAGSVGVGMADPEVGIDFKRLVHGAQEFVWGEPVCSGDTIITTARVADIYERSGLSFFVFRSESRNQDGVEVVHGTWTHIVRGTQ